MPTTPLTEGGRRRSGRRKEKEGEDLSRAHMAVWETQTRGARWLGGRKMV